MVVVAISGCDDTFEPLQPNTKYAFSMYGTLDVTADTQWVRVMPIGERLFNNTPDPNGTVVTLKNMESNVTITLEDSLFEFGGPAYVWNYYSTTPLEQETWYELKATTPDGRSSSATVRTPKRLSSPTVGYNNTAERGEVDGFTDENLVVAEVTYWAQFIDDLGNWTPFQKYVISVLGNASVIPIRSTFRFTFESRNLLSRAVGVSFNRIRIDNVYVRVATSDTTWPSYMDLSDEEAVMPDVVSNVEFGTGYVATVSSHYLPVPRGF
jgi:hypothetical protein